MTDVLTYCLNVHPTQTFDDVRAALTGPVRAVKRSISPDRPFPVGLRLSAECTAALTEPALREELAGLLSDGDLRPVTMNGFPYGPFHGTRVKEEVYLPDWRSEDRVRYSTDLADLLAALNPEGTFVSLSTVPGAFRPNGAGAEAVVADNILRVVAHLVALARDTGRHIALAIEPEPCCFLETIAETVTFFETWLFSDAAEARLSELADLPRSKAAEALRAHLGLCYDVCHAAVEYEDAAGSIAALRGAGIPVHKLQLSSALRIPSGNPAAREALRRFDEPTYLHQLIARGEGGLTRFTDLGEALAPGGACDGEEWRVHFHVPVFIDTLPDFATTQDFLREILALHRAEPISPHLEIETYTWQVLPEGLAAGSVEDAVTREIEWVREQLS
ncbi:Sugar phosphate isomerase family enzyme [Roseivivax marinus]|uniref:Sugar phosphate isomerase family enzyme n=1 Tax=Roseivivax marinus TaxID=1379903 RepID=W4HG67_9RHOB|nr:metabolite traffic protein EboE [Roseivivax marinus]ETW11373.1 Sugar phosphate isomerase family enzyme [Roseivivax marinus]